MENIVYIDSREEEILNVKFTREVYNQYTLSGELVSSTEEDFITISAPGDQTNVIHELVDDSHKQRFKRQWMAYKDNQSSGGTPVEQWDAMSQAQAVQFKALGFNFVEQIASANHEAFNKVMGGSTWKKKAQEFIANQQIDESKTIKEQQKEIDELKAMVQELMKKKAS